MNSNNRGFDNLRADSKEKKGEKREESAQFPRKWGTLPNRPSFSIKKPVQKAVPHFSVPAKHRFIYFYSFQDNQGIDAPLRAPEDVPLPHRPSKERGLSLN